MPSSELVTKWAVEWANSLSRDLIRKSFDICGLVPREDFDIQKLHKPLRDIFVRDMSAQEWLAIHGGAVNAQTTIGPGWLCYEGKDSFYKAAHGVIQPITEYDEWKAGFTEELIQILREDEATKPLITDEEVNDIKKGERYTDTFLEWYALAAIMQNCIHVITMGVNDIVTNRLEFGNASDELIAFYVQPKLPTKILLPDDYEPSHLNVVEEDERDDEDLTDSASEGIGDEAQDVNNNVAMDRDGEDFDEVLEQDDNDNVALE